MMFAFNRGTWLLYFQFGKSLYWNCSWSSVELTEYEVYKLTPELVDLIIQCKLWERSRLKILNVTPKDFKYLKWLLIESGKKLSIDYVWFRYNKVKDKHFDALNEIAHLCSDEFPISLPG